MTRPPFVVLVTAVVAMGLAGGCGDDTADTTAISTTTTRSTAPTSTASITTTTSETTTTSSSTPSPTTTYRSTIDDVVLSADGLGVVDFGDEAEAVLAVLVETLGRPDFDTGWADPSIEANEPLWPGCPGTAARIVTWDDVMGVVFTDWDQTSDNLRVTVGTPYLAGAGLWPDSPITTPDGARSGDTVGRLRAIYGDRLSVASTEGYPTPWVFAIDGAGGLRGSIQDDIVTDDSMTVGWTAGVSCDTP